MLHKIYIAIDSTMPPSELIADAVKRSSVAHLFHFYPILCDIVSIPRKTPSAWLIAEAASPLFPSLPRTSTDHVDIASQGNIENLALDRVALELDARALARECLKLVGNEIDIGVSI